MVDELQDYELSFTPEGNLTFAARSNRHDDLLSSLATVVADDVPAPTGPVVLAMAKAQYRW